MSLDPAFVLALAAQCAPGVSPPTLLAVARVESALDPLAIGINGPHVRRPRPRHAADAAAQARTLLADSRNIDLGLGQINIRNLARLGLTLEAAFDPCRNLAASALVLREGYRRGAAEVGPGQPALRIALSYYNTGHARRGERNGYVTRVAAKAGAGQRPSRVTPPSPPPEVAVGPAVRLRAISTFVLSPLGAAP